MINKYITTVDDKNVSSPAVPCIHKILDMCQQVMLTHFEVSLTITSAHVALFSATEWCERGDKREHMQGYVSTSTMSINDLPPNILLRTLAYQWLRLQGRNDGVPARRAYERGVRQWLRLQARNDGVPAGRAYERWPLNADVQHVAGPHPPQLGSFSENAATVSLPEYVVLRLMDLLTTDLFHSYNTIHFNK